MVLAHFFFLSEPDSALYVRFIVQPNVPAVKPTASPHEARESLGRGLPSLGIDPANLRNMGPRITEAVGQVLFVQYEDGSTWGNPEAGKRMLDARPKKLSFLKRLVETYYESGQQAFDAILNDPNLPFQPESIVAGCLKAEAEYQKTTPIDLAKKNLAAAQGWHDSGIF